MSLISPIVNRLLIGLLVSLVVQTAAAAAQVKPGERLEYTFRYQGIFSGFIQMKIARVEFLVEPAVEIIDGQKTFHASLDLTTEPFSQAELIYPIRYRYRSWFEPDQQIPLLVSEYLKTDEVNEEFLWFDHANQQGYRYVKQETAEDKKADLPGFVMEKVGITQGEQSLIAQSHQKRFTGNGIWDYLSLLHRLRVMELKPGQVFDLPVYNGKEVKQIQVKVEEEQLQELGWNRLAFKLSLTELRKGKARKDRSSMIWISNDEERLPLRFYTKRAFGVVDGILETGRPMMARHDAFSQEPEELQDLFVF